MVVVVLAAVKAGRPGRKQVSAKLFFCRGISIISSRGNVT